MIQKHTTQFINQIRQLGILLCLFLPVISLAQEDPFIRVENGKFMKGEQPYYYAGTNMWYAMNLGAGFNEGDIERLKKELDMLQQMGINNLRIMVGTEGPSDEPWRIQPALQNKPGKLDPYILEGLDLVLVELGRRDMVAVCCLSNFFHWSGGMAQYVSWATQTPIPYPHGENADWTAYQNYSAEFFGNKKAKRYFKRFVKKLLKRKNSITGQSYKDDPIIMAWELANEPRGFAQKDNYVIWVNETAEFIKRKDSNHLVCLGGEGLLHGGEGTAFSQLSICPFLDYLTAHIWVENWGWFDPKDPVQTYESARDKAQDYLTKHIKIADEVNKPLVLEEFGMSRDGGEHRPEGSTEWRDTYYRSMLELIYNAAKNGQNISGSNVWSWSGMGFPPRPEEFWKEGDPLTGDPPHEKQGWYSIHENDQSTKELLKEFAIKMEVLSGKNFETQK
ncbi:MAG: cellulase family glycosylhydrolase [Bacteroidota bacterium]